MVKVWTLSLRPNINIILPPLYLSALSAILQIDWDDAFHWDWFESHSTVMYYNCTKCRPTTGLKRRETGSFFLQCKHGCKENLTRAYSDKYSGADPCQVCVKSLMWTPPLSWPAVVRLSGWRIHPNSGLQGVETTLSWLPLCLHPVCRPGLQRPPFLPTSLLRLAFSLCSLLPIHSMPHYPLGDFLCT